MKIIDRIVESKGSPSQSNDLWLQPQGENVSLKYFHNGKWTTITGGDTHVVSSDDVETIVSLTQAEFDNIQDKDEKTLYIIPDTGKLALGSNMISGTDGVCIQSIVQTTVSTVDGGTNVWTATLTNGQTFNLEVRNGNQGNSGYSGAAGELEVVNNLTDGGATSALSAEMGKTLNTEVSQLRSEVEDIGLETLSSSETDLDIEDEQRNVLARFAGGHFRTKNFNSEEVPETDEDNSAFAITDEAGNAILVVEQGHIYTKKFSSKELASGSTINCVGDSLTQGQTGLAEPNSTQVSNNAYPTDLSVLLGENIKVFNYGFGGNTAFDVISSMNISELVLPFDFTLKADKTATAITSDSAKLTDSFAGQQVTHLLTQYRDTTALKAQQDCSIYGIPCILSLSGGNYSVSRKTTGDADISVKAGMPMQLGGAETSDAIYIILLGQNNLTFYTQNSGADWVAYMKKVTAGIPSGKYLILGIPNANPSYVDSVRTTHSAMRAEFGARFLDLQKYLSSLLSFQMAGLTPTADADISQARYDLGVRSDEYCIQNGLTASSYWRYSGTINPSSSSDFDSIHLNAAGYSAIAQLVSDRLTNLKWINK